MKAFSFLRRLRIWTTTIHLIYGTKHFQPDSSVCISFNSTGGENMVVNERNKDALSTSEVAHLINVHINTVRRWSNRGILRSERVGPRGDRIFLREDVNRLLIEIE